MKVKVKKKKVLNPFTFAYFYEQLFQDNKDLRIQVAHLQDELNIYKNKPNYWAERTVILSRENEELKQKLAEMEK